MTFEKIGEKLYKEMFPANEKENMGYRLANPRLIQWETDFCRYRVEATDSDTVQLSACSKRSGGRMLNRIYKVSGEKITQIDQSFEMMRIWSVFQRQYTARRRAENA